MILSILLLLQSPFQVALDAAPPGATIIAADYQPLVKRGIHVLKPVTIIGGVFAPAEPCGRSVQSLDGSEPEQLALTVYDQDLSARADQVRLVGSWVFGPLDVRFDRLVLDGCRVYGDVRVHAGSLSVDLLGTLVIADQRAEQVPRAAVGAVGCTVSMAGSFVRGGRSDQCPSDGAPGVRCQTIVVVTGTRARGGLGRCGGQDGKPWEAATIVTVQ